ncbi:hypothetical protein CR513_49603, partial [Mucuna pruriens]
AWEQSNRLSLNFMRLTMVANVKSSMSKTNDARKFMKLVKEYSQSDIIDKSILGTYKPIYAHLTKMSNLAAKLKSMGMKFQVNYNTLREKWNFQEIKAILIQEEGRLKKVKDDSIHLMTYDGANTSKRKLGKKD